MEGTEQFVRVLRDTYGTEPFTAHDVLCDLATADLPPATRVHSRQRSIIPSIGKHLAVMPSVERAGKGYWRMLT